MKLVPRSEIIESLLVEARQLSVALPVLEPLLKKRKESAYQRLLGNYRDGKHDQQQPIIAELFVLENIVSEINSKLDNLKYEQKG